MSLIELFSRLVNSGVRWLGVYVCYLCLSESWLKQSGPHLSVCVQAIMSIHDDCLVFYIDACYMLTDLCLYGYVLKYYVQMNMLICVG